MVSNPLPPFAFLSPNSHPDPCCLLCLSAVWLHSSVCMWYARPHRAWLQWRVLLPVGGQRLESGVMPSVAIKTLSPAARESMSLTLHCQLLLISQHERDRDTVGINTNTPAAECLNPKHTHTHIPVTNYLTLTHTCSTPFNTHTHHTNNVYWATVNLTI